MRQFIKWSLVAFAASLSGTSAAQTSKYFITEGSLLGSTRILQHGGQVGSYYWASQGQMPLFVGATVRQANYAGTGGRGDEYTLNGVPTGIQNHWNNNHVPAYDAAFDGKRVFMIDYLLSRVASWDVNFENRVDLFDVNFRDLGITFDTKRRTIWTSNWGDGRVSQWDLTGVLVSSFVVTPSAQLSALAYDPADDTMWLYNYEGRHLEQYDQAGNLQSRYNSPMYAMGGEFAIVPEPSSLIAAGLGVIALSFRRWVTIVKLSFALKNTTH